MLTVLGIWFAGWFSDRQQKREARHAALRHVAVIAQAVWTGSTAGYTLTPDLPRQDNSTEIEWR